MKRLWHLLPLVILLFCACKSRPRHVLSPSRMVDVLVDLHLADAFGTSYGMMDIDSASLYFSVFEKNQTTRASFDSSLVYYVRNANEFNKIYDKVVEALNRRQTEYRIAFEEQEKNPVDILYEDSRIYRFPIDTVNNRLPFTVEIRGEGLYIVEATLKLLRKDPSVNPRITVWFWRSDSLATDSLMIEPLPLKKGNRQQKVELSYTLANNSFTHLSGLILDHDNDSLSARKMAEVYNIRVIRKNIIKTED